MEIRAVKQDDGLLYKCVARNEFGSSERLIKLIVLGVPERPSQVRVRDIWSRSALISWQSQYPAANSRVSNYTVQYWRKNGPSSYLTSMGSLSNQNQQQQQQNHRREQITVDGLQNSALLTNLLPSITYELSVLAHNPVGQSEASETINVTTSEEEPSAPPSDVQVEARGSSTLRVMWKIPPRENHNGRLLGFYIGYRPRVLPLSMGNSNGQLGGILSSSSNQQQQLMLSNAGLSSGNLPSNSQQQQQQLMMMLQQTPNLLPSNGQQSLVFSFKTADAIENQLYYDTFLTNLKPNHDYEVTVRAFNKAGSGPDCHTLVVRTGSPRLPSAPNLQVQRVSGQAVTLRWTTSVLISAPRMFTGQHSSILASTSSASTAALSASSSSLPGDSFLGSLRFVLCYQPQGERDWYELSVNQQLLAPATRVGDLANPLDHQIQSSTSFTDSGDSSLSLVGLMNTAAAAQHKPLDELTSELLSSHHPSQLHTLSNLQPDLTYRIYVAAANEFGMGDPSNVVSIRTEPINGGINNNSMSGLYQPGAALLEASNYWGADIHGNPNQQGSASFWAHQLQPLYTVLTSAALLLVIVILLIYLVWQFRLRRHRSCATNSSGSYPSSWTPAATDTIQSEYSVKRHFPLPHNGHSSGALDTSRIYDKRQRTFHSHNNNNNSSRNTSNGSSQYQQQQQQLLRTMNTSQTIRPVLSSHYHLPADLINSSANNLNNNSTLNSSTLQLHSALNNNQLLRHQSKTSTTLNRNQNRQLPPIPYSTLSVKEATGINQPSTLSTINSANNRARKQQQQQSTTPEYRICKNQQAYQQQAPAAPPPPPPTQISQSTLHSQREIQSTGGSQTPLIYGVIE